MFQDIFLNKMIFNPRCGVTPPSLTLPLQGYVPATGTGSAKGVFITNTPLAIPRVLLGGGPLDFFVRWIGTLFGAYFHPERRPNALRHPCRAFFSDHEFMKNVSNKNNLPSKSDTSTCRF